MAILKMKKLSLITPKENTNSLTKDLMWLSCVEVISPDAKEIEDKYENLLQTPTPDENYLKVKQNIEKITQALSAVGKYRKKKGLFNLPDELCRCDFEKIEDSIETIYPIVDKIIEIKNEQAKIKNKINFLSSQLTQLTPWQKLDIPLETASTTLVDIEFGTLPITSSIEKLEEELAELSYFIEEIEFDREQRYICAFCHKSDCEEFIRIMSSFGFTKTLFRALTGTPKECVLKISTQSEDLNKEYDALEGKLCNFSDYASKMEKLFDYESSRLTLYAAKGEMMSTLTTSIIEGWVPENELKKLENVLSEYECYYELSDPTENDNPPTELKNNRFAASFEGLIGLYSYPSYNGYDPLKYMSIFYCIIFGIMLADVVYGAILAIGGFLAIKLLRPKKSMRSFLEMFAWSGVTTAIAGLLFGSIMGDLPSAFASNMLGMPTFNTALWFDPTKNPIALLLLSFVIGGIHLLWGMGINAYMLFKRGKWLDAVCDVFTWYLLFVGLGVWGSGVVISNFVVSEIGKWLSISGVLSLILTQGRAEKNIIMRFAKGILSLYGIVNYMSDLLSYSRILALGLATAVVSSVINIMATLAGPSIIGFIMFIVILLLGHTLNITLNVLGSFVHASRLQYIEFFGKFYEDGGRHFAPIAIDTKYTRINLTEEN